MQLDADEDGEPFFRPQRVVTAPIPNDQQRKLGDGSGGESSQLRRGEEDEEREDGETAQAAAATATIEQEE